MSNSGNNPSTLHTYDGIELAPHTYPTLFYINRFTGAVEPITGIVTVSGRIIADNGDSDFVDMLFSTKLAAIAHQLDNAERALKQAQIAVTDLSAQLVIEQAAAKHASN